MLIALLQTERAFQKQRGVFLNPKAGISGKKKKKEQRFVRNVGLGFKTPREVRLASKALLKCKEYCSCALSGMPIELLDHSMIRQTASRPESVWMLFLSAAMLHITFSGEFMFGSQCVTGTGPHAGESDGRIM